MDHKPEIFIEPAEPQAQLVTQEKQHTRLIELNQELIKRRRKRQIDLLSTSAALSAVPVVLIAFLFGVRFGLKDGLLICVIGLFLVVAPLIICSTTLGAFVDRQSRKQLKHLECKNDSYARQLVDEGSTVNELEEERQEILRAIATQPIARSEGGVSLYEDERARGALSVDGEG